MLGGLVSHSTKGILLLGIPYIMHKLASDYNTQNVYPQFLFTANFNYSRFDKPELQRKAKTTLNHFISFIHQTFDGLLKDRKLNNLFMGKHYFIISNVWKSICIFLTP